MTRGERQLQIVSAGVRVNVDKLSRDEYSGELFEFHCLRVYLGNIHAARGYDSFFNRTKALYSYLKAAQNREQRLPFLSRDVRRFFVRVYSRAVNYSLDELLREQLSEGIYETLSRVFAEIRDESSSSSVSAGLRLIFILYVSGGNDCILAEAESTRGPLTPKCVNSISPSSE